MGVMANTLGGPNTCIHGFVCLLQIAGGARLDPSAGGTPVQQALSKNDVDKIGTISAAGKRSSEGAHATSTPCVRVIHARLKAHDQCSCHALDEIRRSR
jgi:hypothetical protein